MGDLMQVTNAPGTAAHWMAAVDAQVDALSIIQMMRSVTSIARDGHWEAENITLTNARPYAWSSDTIKAVLAAGRSIPSDSMIAQWNLQTSAVWWYFENPLPFRSVEDASLGVKALNIGWVSSPSSTKHLYISAWIFDGKRMMPSQTFLWKDGIPLNEMLSVSRNDHNKLYGQGGDFAEYPNIGVDAFIYAADGLARFVMGGLVWLNQKVLAESTENVERHARKRYTKATGREFTGVQVVNLRRIERPVGEPTTGDGEGKREFSCQWQVDGHFRNQAFGSGMTQRRLTWISPYIKGPEDKPLRIPRQKVYVVNR